MIEEAAVVTRIGADGRTWIKSLQTSACSGCMQQQSCGTATLAKVLPKREFAVDSDIALQAGDRVVVAIDDGHLLLTSLILYLLPLLIMLGGVGLAQACLPPPHNTDYLPEIALTSLLAGFALINRCQNLLLLHLCFKPQILKKLPAA
ncbi:MULTISPECIES: SoxR reducing system RseC family protein [Methylomonas]|uniref:Sigma E positive regulator RseC/MucC n=1 Tax=Methylomonas koyamae TaxID=702114 RepID=A0A291IFV6_9GAMM|nr:MULTISPECIES: SoxR reducing system RseC family protein [Methylomonas]ANE54530.1 sigma E positive regulator RseC/MucC [Methylomonas sp. DH-1]ATG89182.1 sigma E positive regulator RseC/MucC [Methylomonas koyamae]OAI24090.1 sigma E positive regulator RseC/MucC [Methylomonas koyamae]